jgi:predicted CopG family antitoxin
MGTKTISVKDEAYRRLTAARRYPDESFSEVILRATWPEDTITAAALLALAGKRRVHLSQDELDRAATQRKRDRPPEDKWAAR